MLCVGHGSCCSALLLPPLLLLLCTRAAAAQSEAADNLQYRDEANKSWNVNSALRKHRIHKHKTKIKEMLDTNNARPPLGQALDRLMAKTW